MIDPTLKQLIINKYQSGKSIAALSRETGVSTITISKWLRSYGIEIRKDNYQKIHLDIDEVNRLYNEGMSTYEIAKKFDCSNETVRKIILEIRPPAIRNKHTNETIQKIKESSTALWYNEAYRKKVKKATSSPEYKQKLSTAGKKHTKRLAEYVRSQEGRDKIAAKVRAAWRRPEYRKKIMDYLSTRMPELLKLALDAVKSGEKREEWIRKLRVTSSDRRESNTSLISNAQKQLYYLLEISGIQYLSEGTNTRVGPFYVVDCIIPKQQQMCKPLIIEVDGEYWHSLPHVITKDKQKDTYVVKYTEYDLLRLSDLDISSFELVASILYKHGLTLRSIKCTTKSIEIKQKSESAIRDLYRLCHYSSTIRRGATTFGAYFKDKLVGAISYTHPIRLEVSKSFNCDNSEILEISRIARLPNLICGNLISFLIGATRKRLSKNIKLIVTYSDETYGHTGTVYSAAGFKQCGVVDNDYHYISTLGRFHKKTIWDRAKKMRMSEEDYAIAHGLIKVETGPKTRWVYKLNSK